MITDEKLRLVASFTTKKGTVLSRENNVDLLVKDTSHGPQTYDIYVDRSRGGITLPTTLEGKYIKKPLSLYGLLLEQYPDVRMHDRDTYNLHISSDVAVVGSRESPYLDMFYGDEFTTSAINMDNAADQLMLQANPYLYQDPYTAIETLVWKHSAKQFAAIDFSSDIFFHKRYGRFLFNRGVSHGNGTFRLVIYNANGTVSSDMMLTNYNTFIEIAKGQYARIYIKFTPGNIDSKNNNFLYFAVSAVNGIIPPALFIGKWFRGTHTINIYNDGLILGKGGDGINSTLPPYSSDQWNVELENAVKEDFVRNQAGGDAIMSVDVAAINIYNNGVIAGGGGAARYGVNSQANGRATYYAAPGGAPLGKGTVTYSKYDAANGGGVLPFIYGTAAGLTTPATNGAGLGESITNRSSDTAGYYNLAGMFYRGCRNVNFYGSGQYKGPSCLTPNLVNQVG